MYIYNIYIDIYIYYIYYIYIYYIILYILYYIYYIYYMLEVSLSLVYHVIRVTYVQFLTMTSNFCMENGKRNLTVNRVVM